MNIQLLAGIIVLFGAILLALKVDETICLTIISFGCLLYFWMSKPPPSDQSLVGLAK